MSRRNVASGQKLRDHDLILNVTAPVSSAGAAIRIPCNPRFWPNTKAYQHSLGFQCYSPRAIAVHWRPAVAATTAGLVVGASLAQQQSVSMSLIANALMSVPGSSAGPVWKDLDFKFDLSMLTQAKYFLNEVGEEGVPCDLFLTLPSTAVGFVEISYDIDFYGHCTAPVSTAVYDIVPRSWTAPPNLTTTYGTLGSVVGLTGSNTYNVVFSCNPTISTNITLQATSGGGGPTCIDTSYFNSRTVGQLASGSNFLINEENFGNLYLSTASMQGLVTYIWLSGDAN